MLVLCGSCEFYDNRNGGFILIRIKEELKNAAFLHNAHSPLMITIFLVVCWVILFYQGGGVAIELLGSRILSVSNPMVLPVQVFLSLARHIHITS